MSDRIGPAPYSLAMTVDDLFRRYSPGVLPLFWPVLWLALCAYMARKRVLFAEGCIGIELDIAWWGRVRIRRAFFADADPGWKERLYAATGAYGTRPLSARHRFGTGALQTREMGTPHGHFDDCGHSTRGATDTASPPLAQRAGNLPAMSGTRARRRQGNALLPLPHT